VVYIHNEQDKIFCFQWRDHYYSSLGVVRKLEPGGLLLRNSDNRSWTKSAAAIPVISAVVGLAKRPWNLARKDEQTIIICRSNFHNIGTPIEARSAHRQGCKHNVANTNTKFNPASPRMMRLSSRVVHPPGSGVPAQTIIRKLSQESPKNFLLAGARPGSARHSVKPSSTPLKTNL
jgi:hypothetical protein